MRHTTIILFAILFVFIIVGMIINAVYDYAMNKHEKSLSERDTKIYDYLYNTSNKQYKMFRYSCPKCGQDLEHIVQGNQPPKHFYKCNHCDFIATKTEDLIRLPYTDC